jgi:hypothetical protein
MCLTQMFVFSVETSVVSLYSQDMDYSFKVAFKRPLANVVRSVEAVI